MGVGCLDQSLNLRAVESINRSAAQFRWLQAEFPACVLNDVLGLVISKVMLAP